jgi:Zn-dependent protease with chaperone function
MLIYGIIGLVVLLFFDIILKGGEHELVNIERILILLLWPLMLGWFIFFLIKNNKNNKNEKNE